MEHFQPTYDRKYTTEQQHGEGAWDAFCVQVAPGFGTRDCYAVTIVRGNSGSTIQPEIVDWRKACELADHLYAVLLPEYVAERQAAKVQRERFDEERRRQAPKRAADKRKRLQAALAAPLVDAAECPECNHLADPEEFEVPAYECSTCGTVARGEDGRRCESCHKFTARASTHSCPSCESALDETLASVQARQMPDGSYLLDSEVQAEAAAAQ